MKVTLCNRGHPEYGAATIPLPIPDEEYARCMELLSALGIGSVTDHDCYVERIIGAHPALNPLKDTMINVDELDYLARSLEQYSDRELPTFYKLVDDVEGYGKNALYELCEDQEIVDTVDGFMDWDSFGRHMLEEDGLVFTEHGYLRLPEPDTPEMEQTMSFG